MATFEIKSSSLNSTYEFQDENLFVKGSFAKNAIDNTVTNINGTCYRVNGGETGELVGNFNGYPREGGIRYSLSEMSRADSELVWNAIEAIEANVTGANE